MTTIAYKQGVLASDTGATMGGSRLGRVEKIVRAADGRLAAAAGNAAYAHAFRAWVLKGEGEPPSAKSDDPSVANRGIIFHPCGRIQVFEDVGSFDVTAPYYAIGSGRPEALGAMHAGATAEQAVRAAMEHDEHTFGEVLVLTHHMPLKEAAE